MQFWHPTGTHGNGYKVGVSDSWLQAKEASGEVEVWEGVTPTQKEYVVPRELFEEFNRFPREKWTPGESEAEPEAPEIP
jgi:hypothetical protein